MDSHGIKTPIMVKLPTWWQWIQRVKKSMQLAPICWQSRLPNPASLMDVAFSAVFDAGNYSELLSSTLHFWKTTPIGIPPSFWFTPPWALLCNMLTPHCCTLISLFFSICPWRPQPGPRNEIASIYLNIPSWLQ